jgi:anti-repressor protein
MTEETLEKAITSPDFLIKLATQLKTEQEARKKAEATIEQQKPLIQFANTVTESSKAISMDEMSKLCNKNGIDIGRNRLFKFLRDNHILMSNNIPYQQYMDWFTVVEVVPRGTNIPCLKTLVTGKG